MKTIYVGCSLTHASPQLVESVEILKGALRKAGYKVLEFVGLIAGTPQQVYRHDIHHCVGKCDLFVAICDDPAIGLGYEMGVAIEKRGIPVLATAKTGVTVSRLVLGIDHPNFQFMYYGNLVTDVMAKVREMLHSDQLELELLPEAA